MNTLFLSYDGMTDHLGPSQVIPYIQRIAQKGHQVHLVSFEKKGRYAEKADDIRTLLKRSGITWHPLFYSSAVPVLSAMWNVSKMNKKVLALHNAVGFDLIHCRSYIFANIGQKMQQKFGLKFIFDIRGFWPDERVDGGLWNLQNPVFKVIYSYYKRKEKGFFESADVIISLTKSAKEFIERNFNVKRKVVVIPCAVDLELFKPQSTAVGEDYRQKLGLKNEYVLLYLGSIGTWYLLEKMLDFFVVLKTEKEDAKFLFLTGDNPSSIYDLAKKKGISRDDVLINKCDRSEVVKYLSVANSSVFFIKNCFSKTASSPTKHGELLGCTIPTVCNEIGDLREIIGYRGAGVLVEKLYEVAYRSAIKELLDLDVSKTKYLDTAVKYYSLEEGAKRFIEAYELG